MRGGTIHGFCLVKQLLEMIITVSKRTGDSYLTKRGIPGGSGGKESTCHARGRFALWVRKIPLELEMATHSSSLACEIPWTEGPGRLESTESQRVHDSVTK